MKRLAIVAVIVLGAGLRLFHLGAQSLTYDEGVTLYFARRPLGELAATMAAAGDPHPPLYYSLMHFWIQLCGISEAALRLPSAVFGIITIPLVFAVARRISDEATALLATLLFAVSGFSIGVAQEARSYTMATFMLLLTTYLLLRVLGDPRRIEIAALAVCASLSMYTHYFALLLFPVWMTVAIRDRNKRSAFGLVVGLLLFAPWMPWLAAAVRAAPHFPSPPIDVPMTLLTSVLQMGLSTAIQFASAPIVWAVSIDLLLLALATIGARHLRRYVLLPELYVTGPVVMACAALVFGLRIFYAKYTVMLCPVFLMLIAAGIQSCPRILGSVLLLTLLTAQGVCYSNEQFDWRFQHQDTRGMVGQIKSQMGAGDVIFVTRSMDRPVVEYYCKAIGVNIPIVSDASALTAEHVWVIYFPAVSPQPWAPHYSIEHSWATSTASPANCVGLVMLARGNP